MTQLSSTLFSADKSDYLSVLKALPEQLATAKDDFLKQVQAISPLIGLQPDHVVFCGMGGSAIAGDFVKRLIQDRVNCSIETVRDYLLPPYLSSKSFVIFSSYSGNTEETLAAYESAISKKAAVICLSTGGKLVEKAEKMRHVVIRVRQGMQPRQSLPFGLVAMLGICETILTSRVDWQSLDEAIALGKQLSQAYAPAGSAEMVDIARTIVSRPVVVLSSERMLPAAVRLKGQLSENSKILAFASPIPEMNHNEIVGWDGMRSSCNAIIIRDDLDHPRVAARLDIMTRLLERHTTVVTATTRGSSLLARFISLICWSDWISYYAALIRNIDPTPVDIITDLKDELAQIPQK